MTIEDFINTYDPGCGDQCADRKTCDTLHPDTRAALAELAALREQVKTARLEGARRAWRIAFYWVFDSYGKSDAREQYRKAFGEEAP